MLPSKNRLRDKKIIQALLAAGKWAKEKHFTLKYEYLPQSSGPEAVVIISSRIAKKSAERNRLRRRITETLRPILNEPGVPNRLAIIPRSSALTLSYKEIKESLCNLLKKLS